MSVLIYSSDRIFTLFVRAAIEDTFAVRSVLAERWLISALASGQDRAVVLDGADPQAEEMCVYLSAMVDVPIVVVAASAEPFERVRFLHAGADDVLPRPFAAQELQVRLRAKIQRADLERRRRRKPKMVEFHAAA